ncbi:DUF1822 family protein [Leptolyngbya ohadii]|uniref:DUF1822 family protein n=1 Tax=Leptolyngbya ohadii TaxID=1962290 RepID=UPI0015C5AA0A|nr:DUF1822 family protein [Leptolyngbya ohadii]
MTLMFDTSLRLPIPEQIHADAWQQYQAMQGDRWQAYLNHICFATIRQWLIEKFGSSVRSAEPIDSSEFWELVNGSALTISSRSDLAPSAVRMVFIPSEAIDRLEFRVPQEWIDLADWAGDYYWAIEVNPDDQWIEVWGYTTHERLKIGGEYDADDRSYYLDSGELITDLNVLWTMLELGAEVTRASVADLSPLSQTQAENLVTRLSQTTIPRLEIPFTMWGSLLANPQWRRQLSQSRQSIPQSAIVPSAIVQLGRWLQNQFEAGWQAIETRIDAPAFILRQDDPSAAVQRVKQLVLSPEVTVSMLVSLSAEADGRIAVQVRLLPAVESLLPENISLSLLSETGDVLQSVQARQQDNSIQLRRFRCSIGTAFRLQVALAEGGIAFEDFVV